MGYDYTQETLEFVRYGISCYNARMLGATEDEHCNRMFDFMRLDGWLDGKVVVDVGCGVGGVLERMKRRFPNNAYLGLTNCALQLQICAERGVSCLYCDMDDGLFPAADLFMFAESIGHSKSTTAVLTACAAKLPPGGRVFVKDFNGDEDFYYPCWDWRTEPAPKMIAAAEAAGLRLLEVDYPVSDNQRYRAFWQQSAFMCATHGQPWEQKAHSEMFLFEKP